MDELTQCLRIVRRRLHLQQIWNQVSAGLIVVSPLACGLAVFRSMDWLAIPWPCIFGWLAAGPVVGSIRALLQPPQDCQAATEIDNTCALKDRVTTAINFQNRSKEQSACQMLQLEDVRQHLLNIDAKKVIPLVPPKSWMWGLSVTFVTLLIAGFGGPHRNAAAVLAPNETVVAQANALQQQIKELDTFVTEEVDPEMANMIQQLAARLEELQQPGTTPRKAMATLSKMEAVLQSKQAQLIDPQTDAQLAEIGEALSLSKEMRPAGQAMAQGELKRAASELSELEMPVLTQQTETTITEQLEQLSNQKSKSRNPKTDNAAKNTAEALRQQDATKFKESMKELAEESRKQDRRNTVTEMLQRQLQALVDSKAEFASALRLPGSRKNKAADMWGLGEGENKSGPSTEQIQGQNQLDLTGQQTEEGESETETVSAGPAAQEAVRRYREQSGKYEQLSESVLKSERIPLGHRQTIRRYFELIRPQKQQDDSTSD
jgi:hypothetical protein